MEKSYSDPKTNGAEVPDLSMKIHSIVKVVPKSMHRAGMKRTVRFKKHNTVKTARATAARHRHTKLSVGMREAYFSISAADPPIRGREEVPASVLFSVS